MNVLMIGNDWLIVLGSRCGDVIKDGWDYRWHFDKHLDEFDSVVDKTEYIERTTQIVNDRLIEHINNK